MNKLRLEKNDNEYKKYERKMKKTGSKIYFKCACYTRKTTT